MMEPGEEEVEASGEQDVVVDTNVESDAESPDANAESTDSEDSGNDVEPAKVAAPDPRDLRIRLLEKQLEESEARLRDYIKAHKKAQSEFEGLRTRLRRDQEEQIELAKGKVVERFLDVADNLDRSIQAAQTGGSLESLLSGVELVHRMFDQALTELGLEKHDPKGEPFDPMSMEAHGMIPVSDASQANHVVNTLRAGYRIKGRELRPALVQVGVHTP